MTEPGIFTMVSPTTPEGSVPTVVAPETPDGVFSAVEDALHRTFGVDGRVERTQQDERSATFSFTSRTNSYSLSISVV